MVRNMTNRMWIVLAAVSMTSLTGCSWFGGGRAEELDANRRFAPAPVAPVTSTPSGVDQPGVVPPREETSEAARSPSEPAPIEKKPSARATPAHAVSDDLPAIPEVIREQVSRGPTNREANQTESAGSTTRAMTGRSIGSYMTLGGVVAEVNNRPIYANQVLREIIAPLSARAKDLDANQFHDVAYHLIDQQIHRLANNELETAVADRNLDEKDKDLARMAAARWRQRQITECGGSLEIAKRKWAADGYDFEERVDQEYRTILVQLYYSRKVWPRVQVTADEIRRYYNQHINDQFTVKDEVRFRLIKVDVKRTGSREAALNKIKDLRARANRGEDFAEMAGTVNDDKYLMSQHGDVGWVQRDSYINSDVEKAAWNLQPGQVSDIIDTGTAFYIAKVEERKLGRIEPFDEQAVQDTIVKNLKAEQFHQLRDKVMDKLTQNWAFHQDADMINTAVDMAMQDYPKWHSGETE